MPDRYDPKLSVRPPSDRNTADAHRAKPAEDDPLVELAKIVSGRSTHGGAGSSPRGRTVPAAPAPARPAEPDILADLEAELLSDLQASFSAIKDTFTAPPPSTAQPAGRAEEAKPRAARPAEAPVPEARARSATPPRQPESVPAQPPPRPARPLTPPPPQPESRPVQASPRAWSEAARVADRPAGPAAVGRAADERAPLERDEPAAAPPPPRPAAEPPPASERPPANLRTPPSDRTEIPNLHLRTTAAPGPPQPAPPQAHPRWEKPEQPAAAPSRFAPPRADAPVAPPPVDFEATEEEPFSEGPPFAADDADIEEELPFGDFDMVPGYGDDDQLPYPDEDLAPVAKRHLGRRPLILAAAVAVVLIAGVSFIMFRGGGEATAPPPIITADSSPTKITPPAAPTTQSDQNKLIYDRVASADSGADGTADTTLVTPNDQPVSAVPTTGADNNNPISRVIAPGGPGYDQPGAEQSASAAPATTDDSDVIEPIGPRKVRTVVVRPDGTIVSSESADAGSDTGTAAAGPATAPIDNQPPATGAATTAEQTPVTPAVPAATATDNDTTAIAGTNGGLNSNGELAITPVPAATGGGSANAADQPAAVPTPAPTPPAPTPPAPKAAPTVVAGRGNNEPIDITPGRPATRSSAPAQTALATTASGGMMVQVSSQRSEAAAQATFKDLQSRYPGILGNYQLNVQRADLGDRGIFYRARVGPFSPADAQHLCNDLKAAGGDCILARN